MVSTRRPRYDVVSGLDASAFTDDGLCQLFQAHLAHGLSRRDEGSSSDDSGLHVDLNQPAWLTTVARDAWTSQVIDGNLVSYSHLSVIKALKALGVKHEVERLTDDGYFSMDIYLPDHDVCVEVDGPSHYYRRGAFVKPSQSRRTAITELRDFFLEKRCAKLVTVPWFEWHPLQTPEDKVAYVKAKLANEAGIEV